MCGLRERSSRDRWRVSKCGACVFIAHNFVTAYVNYFGLMWGGGRESVWDPLSVSHTWDSRFSRRVVLFEIFAFFFSPSGVRADGFTGIVGTPQHCLLPCVFADVFAQNFIFQFHLFKKSYIYIEIIFQNEIEKGVILFKLMQYPLITQIEKGNFCTVCDWI